MAAVEQLVREVRAYESGPACDEIAHPELAPFWSCDPSAEVPIQHVPGQTEPYRSTPVPVPGPAAALPLFRRPCEP